MTTRDPVEVLRERTALLEEELRSLDQKRREHAAIDGELERVVSELGKSRSLLDRLQKTRPLPMLDGMRIASPCSANWNDMVGDEKSRYCGKCEKNVYNLSAMTREEAELTVLAKEGDLCVRLYQRTDGTVLTQDCPVGVRRKRLRLAGVLAIGSSMAGATAALFAGAADDEQYAEPVVMALPPEPAVMGSAVATEPPPVVPVFPHVSRPEGQWVAGGLAARPEPPPKVIPPKPKSPPKVDGPRRVGIPPKAGPEDTAVMGKPSLPESPL